jgi:hypothetical protein
MTAQNKQLKMRMLRENIVIDDCMYCDRQTCRPHLINLDSFRSAQPEGK